MLLVSSVSLAFNSGHIFSQNMWNMWMFSFRLGGLSQLILSYVSCVKTFFNRKRKMQVKSQDIKHVGIELGGEINVFLVRSF